MSEQQIIIYGVHWCPDCRQSKQFLGDHQIPYNWIDIEEDQEAEAFVIKTNKGRRIIPTIVFDDGSVLVEPSNAQLAAKLNLKTTAKRSHYDLVVLGGGPAGLTAALYTAREPYLLETSLPGIFAAGDVRDTSTKQAASAAGEGASAALMICEYLKTI